MRLLALPFIALIAMLFFAVPASSSPSTPVPGFVLTPYGSAGGTVWSGTIPGAFAPTRPGPSFVYLPRGYSRAHRYPVVYLLHGMPGDPLGYVRGARLAEVAAHLIAAGAQPFIAVVPYAGPPTHRGLAEWAGRWESYLVDNVVPWTDASLATIPSAAGRVVAGLSAGGYGAVDIGLRHPNLFGTLESWSGYFTPLPDGPFVNASDADLAAHDPSLLVRSEARLLRKLAINFELSTGVGHGNITPSMTTAFAAELRSLHLRDTIWYVPQTIRGPDYHDQMQHGLGYALARA